ncbi:MAG: protein-L-isoaspartate(D-aspartate) O-methyltransferase [Moraxellaceae bacterium]|jgi:protein-L-isoaspartate(D-aspartate) O-methyltransferase|nr:protein-L-isoaspartate(D-aspartate) O-methyltransferase [Moraxellaceae bacterium]HQV42032.1 protein-L-isoaspartate(D-aspartate) O-methyltransferase [Moraxellaceae bacterium]HQX90205.1 protein-L-isoaspartate(D-aspartate) O-methyltransferase [Moraxellaceae bacterium]
MPIDLQGSGMTSSRTRDRMVNRLIEQGINDINVIEVMRATPRHIFLDEALAHRAYEDTALPIGHGQTLSQPYIVARMTEALLADGPLERVLEIGTGSGFQTAVLAQLVGQVFSVERIKALQDMARTRLGLLKLHNVRLRYTDGGLGWPEEAGFDGIIATAAPLGIPKALIAQLNEGGRLVIPIGGGEVQDLLLITRRGDSHETRVLEQVRFVPMLGGVR